jgi:fructoselysine transporter
MQHKKLSLIQGTALNMIDMVGIGPFITLPFVIANVGGLYLYAWLAGAILSFFDAMVWSELGATYPLAGGSYNFLKQAYGKEKWGKLFSFLYVWQTIIQAPLVAASAAIGFSEYLLYLVDLNAWQQKLVSGSAIVFVTILLYRNIKSIGNIGTLLWIGVLVTILWIIIAGVQHGNIDLSLRQINDNLSWQNILSFAFGQACVKTIYSYLGYYNVCHLGGEIDNPQRNIPKSMFISIIAIAIIYFAMNISVTSIIPWQEIAALHNDDAQKKFVVSIFMERVYGHTAGVLVTIMILWIALSSLFAVMLGYSRIPYAAAVDGAFLKPFAKLHPTKAFPYVSLLVLASIAFIFSLLFKLSVVINGILAMRIVIQFIGQTIGLMLLRNKIGVSNLEWRMKWYPVPIIITLIIWGLVFVSTGTKSMLAFATVLSSGLIVFFVFNRKTFFTKTLP